MRNDLDRLAVLRRLLILDTQPEKTFDDVTSMLARSLGVPIVLVNLLDENRDWFKSCVGLGVPESPAATSFCQTFFETSDSLVIVEDTTTDSRFSTHPLVTGDPFIRFYAAARLVVEGQIVGTLCAYDVRPRRINTLQIEDLHLQASAVADALIKRNRSAQ